MKWVWSLPCHSSLKTLGETNAIFYIAQKLFQLDHNSPIRFRYSAEVYSI